MRFPSAVRAYAPGSVGNLGPGLDVLGLAVDGLGDTVTAERVDAPGVQIAEPGHPDLPSDPTRHAAGIAASAVLRRSGFEGGLVLRIEKGLPLAGGQGGSAASAVAGAVAAAAIAGGRVGTADLLAAALEAESVVAGRHLDNIAPSLLGGMVLIRSLDPIDVVAVPVPDHLYVVLAHPDQRLRTVDGRAALPASVSRAVALHQAAQVGAIVAACASGDLALLGRAIDDRIAEPARAPLLRGFTDAKAAALEAGALGASISGSGPTAFALADDPATAARVAGAMTAAYQAAGVQCAARVARPDRRGATVTVLP
jgi:homoserine kinase